MTNNILDDLISSPKKFQGFNEVKRQVFRRIRANAIEGSYYREKYSKNMKFLRQENFSKLQTTLVKLT